MLNDSFLSCEFFYLDLIKVNLKTMSYFNTVTVEIIQHKPKLF